MLDYRQNFDASSETALNAQINMEMQNAYVYQAMAAFCGEPSLVEL